MLDNRVSIRSGELLAFDEAKKYRIEDVAGRGSSCLVYHAAYTDSAGFLHHVRIKECFPYNMDIERDENGALQAGASFQAQFDDAKEKFIEAYKNNVELKNTLGLMNSTADSLEIYEKNNTWYVITGYVEGTEYSRQEDQCLKDVLIRMAALSKIIQKYHQHGILHLDIKPENILILPETKEHMVLFDFDSLVKKKDLREGKNVRISFSDGFAAPELVQGKKDKICEASDIYSIGALVFYKVFGRTPKPLDGMTDGTYDFTRIKFADERKLYQPELYRKLSDFLHRTLSLSPAFRYRKMKDVIRALKELERLADMDAVFLLHHFSCDTACFVGRQREILEIGRMLEDGHELFLSGIGGIGKTEIVKRYAYENQEKYRKILFVDFHRSIRETVCGPGFGINHYGRGEGEDENDYFNRKLKTLHALFRSDDLVILDNFDVECDDDLDSLLECSCQFLITTREDFRDYNYRQIDIDKMEDLEELLQMFRVYNGVPYDDLEVKDIANLIKLVEWHTMTVELIAKYLRITGVAPSDLLRRMKQKEGITNTEDVGIRHRKDKKMRMKSVNGHLQSLFNLSRFSTGERELIMSLSLLGYVRIYKETFLEYCAVERGEEELERLVKKGWVTFDSDSCKISLHQIILDLVYSSMKPSSENCTHIVVSMTDFAWQQTANWTEKGVKKRLFDSFMQRCKGNDFAYAKLLAAYCLNVKANMEDLCLAEKIIAKREDREARNLMQKICMKKIELEAECSDWLKSELEAEIYLDGKSRMIDTWARQAYGYAKACEAGKEEFGRFCLKMAYLLDAVVNDKFYLYIGAEDDSEALDRLLAYADQLLQEAELCFLEANISSAEKIKVFEKIQEFYSEIDYISFYRCQRYGDPEKGWHYQKILDGLRKEEHGNVVYIRAQDVGYCQIAENAEREGNYEKAAAYFLKGLEEGSEPYELVYQSISEMYQKAGDLEKAAAYLQKVLETDKMIEEETGQLKYTPYICADLIRLLLSCNRTKEAESHIHDLIWHSEQNMGRRDREYRYEWSWILYGHYCLYQLEAEKCQKEALWSQCMDDYRRFVSEGERDGQSVNEEIPDQIMEFLLEYLSQIKDKKTQMEEAFSILEKRCSFYCNESNLKILSFIIETCGEDGCFAEKKILAYLQYAENKYGTYEEEDVREALAYCKKALETYEKYKICNEYLLSLIHKNTGECYANLSSDDFEQSIEEKKKCNYYLLAQKRIAGRGIEEALDIWEDAANAYALLELWQMEERCNQEIFALLDPILYQYEYSGFERYWRLSEQRIQVLCRQKDNERVVAQTECLLEKLLDYEFERNEEKDIGRIADGFSWRLEQIAEYFARIGSKTAAFNVYELAIIAALEQVSDQHFFYSACSDLSVYEKVKEGFAKALHGTVSGKMVDTVMRIWEKIECLELPCEMTGNSKKEMEWFADIYKYRDVEFRR